MKLSVWVFMVLPLASDTVVSIEYVPVGAPYVFVPLYLIKKGVFASTETLLNPLVASVEDTMYWLAELSGLPYES